MEQKFLSWNIENWITVILMAAAGYFVFALALSVLTKGVPGIGGSGNILPFRRGGTNAGTG